jgi:hypothetical protein
MAFERYEDRVVKEAPQVLLEACQQIETEVESFYDYLGEKISRSGLDLANFPGELQAVGIPEEGGLPGHGGKIGANL